MGVARLYRAASPITVKEIKDFDHVQSFDVMYMAHLNYDPLRLERHGHTDWRFATVTFAPTIQPPTGVAVNNVNPNTDSDNGGNAYFPQPASYVVTAVDKDTGQESRASLGATGNNDLSLKRNYNQVSWNVVANADRYRVYKSNNTQDYGFVGSTKQTTFRDDYIGPDLTIGPPIGRNPFTGAGNKPSAVCFFEQRLCFARTINNPNAVYTSRSADFENMDVSVPLRADDAVSMRLVSQGVNQANHLVPLDSLFVFGSDGLFKIDGSNDDYLSASPPPRQRRQSGRGSSRLKPIVIDQIAMYKSSVGNQVRAAGYRFEVDGMASNDVTVFSPHFFEGFDIVSWCYAEEPLSTIWAARSDGALLAFVWMQEQEVWGWTICPLAGNGKVKSLCSINEGGESRVYAIIERTIKGVTKTFRERMASARWIGLHYACHLDCALSRSFDAPTSEVTGLWHLEGETVAAITDGVGVEDLLVTNGTVELPFEASIVTVGLPYDAYVTTLPLSFQTPLGVNQGRKHQTGVATVRLVRSRGVSAGVKDEKLRPIKTRNDEPHNSEASLVNGNFSIATDPVVNLEATVTIHQRILPMTVTAVYLDAETSGD